MELSLTIIILGITALCVGIDGILGLMRGRNRAVLRLFLVAASAAISVALIGYLVPMIMEFEIEGATLKQTLLETFSSGDAALPEKLQALIFVLIEIVMGLAVFFVCFFALKFVTWLVLYPILKIFVRKGRRKGAFSGLVFGLVEGALVAFVICAPITGLVNDFNKVADVEMQGKKIVEIPENIGLEDYLNSPVYKIYNTAGGWFYDMLTSSNDENGEKLSISDTIDVVVTVAGVADKAQQLGDGVGELTKEDATPQDKVNGLDKIGQALVDIDDSINSLDDGGKELLTDLVGAVLEMAGGSGEGEGEGEGESALPPEVEDFVEQLVSGDVNLKSTGEALQGMASYINKTTEDMEGYGEEVTQDEVDSIVNGLADNAFILDMLSGSSSEGEGGESEVPTIIQVEGENKTLFENAISTNESLSDEDKDTLKKLFGLNN